MTDQTPLYSEMSPQDIVRVLYRHFLGRHPDPDGLSGWSSLVVVHGPAFVIKGILESEEYKLRHPPPLRHSKLFFFANPKGGGTSLTTAIKAVTQNHAPDFGNTVVQHEQLAGRYDQFKGYDVYTGHYGRDVFDVVNDNHKYITNFRHPVARLISFYNFVKLVSPHNPGNSDFAANQYCTQAALSMSFADFIACDHPYVRTFTSDFHFRQLTSTPWTLEEPKASIEDACEFIDGALCYYVCEYEEASTRLFRDRLGLQLKLERENTTHDKPGSLHWSEVSDEAFRAVLAINQRDMAIYRHAVNRLLCEA